MNFWRDKGLTGRFYQDLKFHEIVQFLCFDVTKWWNRPFRCCFDMMDVFDELLWAFVDFIIFIIHGMNGSKGKHSRPQSRVTIGKFEKVKWGVYVSTLSPATWIKDLRSIYFDVDDDVMMFLNNTSPMMTFWWKVYIWYVYVFLCFKMALYTLDDDDDDVVRWADFCHRWFGICYPNPSVTSALWWYNAGPNIW